MFSIFLALRSIGAGGKYKPKNIQIMKSLIVWISIASIALMLLGVIHLAATVMVLPMFQNLDEAQFSVFLFMYLAAGIGTVLPGLVSFLSIAGLKNSHVVSWRITLTCALYTCIMGIGAILTMPDNVFAYLSLLIGLSLLLPTFLVKGKL